MATQKIVCDTDVLIEFFDGNKTRHSKTAATIEKIGIDNILISAATSLETGLRLFTYNVRDFKFIKGLNLYNPK